MKKRKEKRRLKKGEFQKAAQKKPFFCKEKQIQKQNENKFFAKRGNFFFFQTFFLTKYEEGEKHCSWWSFNKGNKNDHFSQFFIIS